MPLLPRTAFVVLACCSASSLWAVEEDSPPEACRPIPYGPGTNGARLEAFGNGVLGSRLDLIVTLPQVEDAELVVGIGTAPDDDVVDGLGGTVLVDPASIFYFAPLERFTGLDTAIVVSIPIPRWADFHGGAFYIQGVLADPSGVERNRLTNGIEVRLCALAPDLVVTEVGLPNRTAFVGSEFQVKDRVVNEGTFESRESVIGIFLSEDEEVTTDDILIGERVLDSLRVGFGDSHFGRYRIDASVAPGEYYVGAIVDYQDRNVELDDGNNLAVALNKLTVEGEPKILSYRENPAVYEAGSRIKPNPATVEGKVDYFTVSPRLPSGLRIDQDRGTILGSVAVPQPATDYVITAYNPAGGSQITISIEVTESP